MALMTTRLGSGLDPQTQRRLIWLMTGRLVLAGVSLMLAAGLDGLVQELTDEARAGLYWTVTLAFFAAVISGASFDRIQRPTRFVSLQIAMDIGIVTTLVHFSGGRVSLYTFLYVVVILYSALLFNRRVALGAAGLSASAYALVLVTANEGWGLGGSPSPVPLSILAATWFVHGGAMLLVGVLASVLSGEIERADDALGRSARDLRDLRELHQQTVDSIMSGLLTTDREGRITSINPEAERITGRRFDEVLDIDLEEIIPGAHAVLARSGGRASASSARARLSYLNAHGENLHLGLAGSVLRDHNGSNVGDVVIFQDVTQVVAMEAELRRSERMAAVGELSAKIAHEIRNPLASITGSIQILRGDQDKMDTATEQIQLMDIAIRETDRLNGLITDFLLYARPAPSVMKRVEVSSTLEEVARIFDSSSPENVEIVTQVAPGLEVDADPGQLKQILWNLCLNAVQAMPDGGRLGLQADFTPLEFPQGRVQSHRNDREGAAGTEVSNAETPGDPESLALLWIEIAVSDTGDGIPSDLQERIFEPFFTTKQEGTGLGLSTVHRIVESHGGELQLDSGVGRGTTVRIRLPGTRGSS